MILNFWAKPLWDGNFLEESGTYFREKSFFFENMYWTRWQAGGVCGQALEKHHII